MKFNHQNYMKPHSLKTGGMAQKSALHMLKKGDMVIPAQHVQAITGKPSAPNSGVMSDNAQAMPASGILNQQSAPSSINPPKNSLKFFGN